MPSPQYITAREAIEVLKNKRGVDISLPTLKKWAKDFGFAWQPGGKRSKLFINRERFIEFLNDKNHKHFE